MAHPSLQDNIHCNVSLLDDAHWHDARNLRPGHTPPARTLVPPPAVVVSGASFRSRRISPKASTDPGKIDIHLSLSYMDGKLARNVTLLL